MSFPQAKLPTANELIAKHSVARVICAEPLRGNMAVANMNAARLGNTPPYRVLAKADALAQVASYK